jgi:hypothetical protein
MDRAVRALAASAGRCLAKDYDRPKYEYATLITEAAGQNVGADGQFESQPSSKNTNADAIRQLMKAEHDRAAGAFGPRNDQDDIW